MADEERKWTERELKAIDELWEKKREYERDFGSWEDRGREHGIEWALGASYEELPEYLADPDRGGAGAKRCVELVEKLVRRDGSQGNGHAFCRGFREGVQKVMDEL